MSNINWVWLTLFWFGFANLSSCKAQSEKSMFVYEIKPATSTGSQSKLLILLHGLGSNEQDLFSLAQYIPTNYTVISARAPYPHNGTGYAWYEIDFSSGKQQGNSAQTDKSTKDIILFIQQMSDKYDVKKENIVLAGFSQGAIMSYNVAISSPKTVNKIACFGGRILGQSKLTLKSTTDLSTLQCFVAHGTQDQMIVIDDARTANRLLTEQKVQLSYHEYNDGHTINGDMMGDFIKWLDTIK